MQQVVLSIYGSRTALSMLALAGFFVPIMGCGSSGPAKAPVTGKVTHKGQPVTGGTLTFAPMASADATAGKPGKPATGKIQQDGSYTLGTDSESDGAFVGRHRVLYSAPTTEWETPGWDGKGKPPKPPVSPYARLHTKETEVEVTSGSNEINIELVKK